MSKTNFQALTNALIAKIAKSSEQTAENIQLALLYSTMHALEHGDARLYRRIVDASKGADKKAIVQWIVKHGMASAKGSELELNKSKRKVCYGMTLSDLAILAPFWYESAQTTNAAIKAFDLDKRILSLIAQAEKAQDAGILEHPEKLEGLRRLIA